MTPMLSRRQAVSLTRCDGRVNLWEGAVRSGKTFVSIIAFLMAVSLSQGGGEIVVTGKNRDSIFRNFFRVIEEAAGLRALRDHVKYRQGAPTATIFGRTVHVIGANDAKAEAVIRGMTVLLAYADELTVLPPEFFKQLLARMSPPEARLFATTNPDSSRHWLKVDYLDKLAQLPGWRRFRFTMDDNPSLTTAYKESIRAEYSGLWYKRFIEGQWVAAEGAVFDSFSDQPFPAGNIIKFDDIPEVRELIAVGIDQGSTNPTSAIALALTMDDRLVFTNEWRYEGAEREARKTVLEQAQHIQEWMRAGHLPPHENGQHEWEPSFVFADPAAADFRETMRRVGRGTYRAENDVVAGIQRMASLFASRRLLVADTCKGLLNELPGYVWDTKATSEGRDVPVKQDDHSIDAARYALMSSRAKWSRYLMEDADAA